MNKTNKFFSIFLLISFGFIVIILFVFSDFTRAEQKVDEINQTIVFEPSPIVQPYIPEELYFCGERVPLELFDIREALDRELVINMYRHSSTIMYMKRANRYFPEIERLLDKHGIHDDMKFLCLAESGLLHVVSPAGATGFWQFLQRTAREYGMEVNNNVDERYHHELALVAATKYLKDSYRRFGSWSMAAAAYNVGNAGLQRQVNRQKTNSYWDLHLNTETGRYVYRILALKLVMTYPEKYGFHIPEDYLYDELETYQVIVDTPINCLVEFAHQHGTSYKMLRYFNPWIRSRTLPNRTGKEYVISLPAENVRPFNVPHVEEE